MQISKSGIEGPIRGGAGAFGGVDPESQLAASPLSGPTGSDSVKLSSGSHLVALARASFSDTHTAKVRDIASQLNAGLYRADSGQTSEAVVNGHLRG
jgi:hypothetical protein